MIKATGKISKKKSGNTKYESFWIYLPSKITKNDAFPFKNKEEVSIELNGNSLTINKIYNLSDITESYGFENATLSSLLERKAKENKALPFIYFKEDIYSYQATNQRVNKIAHGLLKFVKKSKLKNPKIGLLLPNCPEYLFCWFGVAKIGCASVSISNSLKEDLLEYLLHNSDIKILIIDYVFYKKYENITSNLPKVKKIVIMNVPDEFKFSKKIVSYQEILSDNIENPNIDINDFQPLEILYTSGTTGKPKGIMYRNYYTLSGISVGRKLETVGLNRVPHKMYCPMPLFQAFPRYLVIIPMMLYNASVILTEQFDISKFWDDVNLYKPDAIAYYGGFLSTLINQEPRDADRSHSIKYAFGMGAFKEIWEAFERRFGITIIDGWSIAEGVGMTINTVGSKGGKIGSVGLPVRGYEIQIVDPEGNELPPGRDHIGEMATRFKLPFELEYYNLMENTSMKIVEDRWVHTGDFGYKDKEGFIYFLGRKSDMIRRGEEIFFAIDIEIIANSHPSILESAFFEVPINNSKDKALKMCAVIKEGASISHKELHEYLKENLAYFMVPRYIEFKKELPKNANELVQKYMLEKEWENETEKKNTYDTLTHNFI
jgi:crotonobetaine/carnitine-CoA ligase